MVSLWLPLLPSKKKLNSVIPPKREGLLSYGGIVNTHHEKKDAREIEDEEQENNYFMLKSSMKNTENS